MIHAECQGLTLHKSMQMFSSIVKRIRGRVGIVMTVPSVGVVSARLLASNAFQYKGGAASQGKGGTLLKESDSTVQDGRRSVYDLRSS